MTDAGPDITLDQGGPTAPRAGWVVAGAIEDMASLAEDDCEKHAASAAITLYGMLYDDDDEGSDPVGEAIEGAQTFLAAAALFYGEWRREQGELFQDAGPDITLDFRGLAGGITAYPRTAAGAAWLAGWPYGLRDDDDGSVTLNDDKADGFAAAAGAAGLTVGAA